MCCLAAASVGGNLFGRGDVVLLASMFRYAEYLMLFRVSPGFPPHTCTKSCNPATTMLSTETVWQASVSVAMSERPLSVIFRKIFPFP